MRNQHRRPKVQWTRKRGHLVDVAYGTCPSDEVVGTDVTQKRARIKAKTLFENGK